jgi:hypothetical protein
MANIAQHPIGLELRLRHPLSNLIDRSGARRKLQHKQEVCTDPSPTHLKLVSLGQKEVFRE